jgi:hypothetical protein
MVESEQWTCGKGVAANAVMPDLMANVLEGTADVLENHIRSLNTAEPAGSQEIAAYRRLVQDHRAISAQLRELALMMRSYRDLPMAQHDMTALVDSRSVDVLDALVQAQQALRQPLSDRAAEYTAMLKEMKKA